MDPRESKLRALYRLVCLLLLPGLSDHFPVRHTLASASPVHAVEKSARASCLCSVVHGGSALFSDCCCTLVTGLASVRASKVGPVAGWGLALIAGGAQNVPNHRYCICSNIFRNTCVPVWVCHIQMVRQSTPEQLQRAATGMHQGALRVCALSPVISCAEMLLACLCAGGLRIQAAARPGEGQEG